MRWYLAVLRKYAVFGGRARRREFWIFALVHTVVLLVLGLVNGLLGADVPALPTYYAAAVFLPCLAVAVRRLHDVDRSGWWLSIVLVPVVGAIALLLLMASPRDATANRFG